MKSKTPRSHSKIAYECHQKYIVMTIFETISDALDSASHEQEVGESIDNFSGVVSRIVVLDNSKLSVVFGYRDLATYLFTPIYGGGYRSPIPLLRRRICYGGQFEAHLRSLKYGHFKSNPSGDENISLGRLTS